MGAHREHNRAKDNVQCTLYFALNWREGKPLPYKGQRTWCTSLPFGRQSLRHCVTPSDCSNDSVCAQQVCLPIIVLRLLLIARFFCRWQRSQTSPFTQGRRCGRSKPLPYKGREQSAGRMYFVLCAVSPSSITGSGGWYPPCESEGEGGTFMVQKINFRGRMIELLTLQGLVCCYISMTDDEKRRTTLSISEICRQREENTVLTNRKSMVK